MNKKVVPFFVCFRTPFRTDFGTQNGPQMASKTLLERGFRWMLFPEHVLSDFQPPRIKKNIKKCYTVCKNQGFQKFPLPTAAIEKCTPKWPQNGSKKASGAIKMRIKSTVFGECYFRTIFGRFLSPKWAPKCAQKSLKHLPWAPQGPPRTPPAGRRPPGSTFGAFWNPFSTHLGAVLGCFGVVVLVVLVVLDCGCGRGGFASGCFRVGCSCGCSRPCFCNLQS